MRQRIHNLVPSEERVGSNLWKLHGNTGTLMHCQICLAPHARVTAAENQDSIRVSSSQGAAAARDSVALLVS